MPPPVHSQQAVSLHSCIASVFVQVASCASLAPDTVRFLTPTAASLARGQQARALTAQTAPLRSLLHTLAACKKHRSPMEPDCLEMSRYRVPRARFPGTCPGSIQILFQRAVIGFLHASLVREPSLGSSAWVSDELGFSCSHTHIVTSRPLKYSHLYFSKIVRNM